MTTPDILLTLGTALVVGGLLAMLARRLIAAQVQRLVAQLPGPAAQAGTPAIEGGLAVPRWPMLLTVAVVIGATAALAWVGTRRPVAAIEPARFLSVDPFATTDDELNVLTAQLLNHSNRIRLLLAHVRDASVQAAPQRILSFLDINRKRSDIQLLTTGRKTEHALKRTTEAVASRLADPLLLCSNPSGPNSRVTCYTLRQRLIELELESDALKQTISTVAAKID